VLFVLADSVDVFFMTLSDLHPFFLLMRNSENKLVINIRQSSMEGGDTT